MKECKYLPLVLVIFILTSCNLSYRKGTLRDVEMTQAETSAEEEFKDKLKRMVLEKTQDPVCAFLYIDGSREEDSYAFVFTGKMMEEYANKSFQGELWYVNGQDCILLTDEIETDSFEPVILETNHHLLYQTSSSLPGSAESYIWTVKERKPQLFLETLGSCFMDNGLLAFVQTSAAIKEGGRSWRRYYLYWDSEKQSYQRYGSKRITEEEFLSYENAQEVRDQVEIAIEKDIQESDAADLKSESHFEYSYIKCDCGIIYVNYIRTGNKGTLYYYSILTEREGTVILEERQHYDTYEKGYMEEAGGR